MLIIGLIKVLNEAGWEKTREREVKGAWRFHLLLASLGFTSVC